MVWKWKWPCPDKSKHHEFESLDSEKLIYPNISDFRWAKNTHLFIVSVLFYHHGSNLCKPQSCLQAKKAELKAFVVGGGRGEKAMNNCWEGLERVPTFSADFFSFLEAIGALPAFCTCHRQVSLSFSEITGWMHFSAGPGLLHILLYPNDYIFFTSQ